MKTEPKIYYWTPMDKWLYALSMIPFAVVFFKTAYLLATYSVYLALNNGCFTKKQLQPQ